MLLASLPNVAIGGLFTLFGVILGEILGWFRWRRGERLRWLDRRSEIAVRVLSTVRQAAQYVDQGLGAALGETQQIAIANTLDDLQTEADLICPEDEAAAATGLIRYTREMVEAARTHSPSSIQFEAAWRQSVGSRDDYVRLIRRNLIRARALSGRDGS